MFAGSLDKERFFGSWGSREEAVKEFPRLMKLNAGDRYYTGLRAQQYTAEMIEADEDIEDVKKHTHQEGSMVVLISGKQGSGKTTTVQKLEEALKFQGVTVKRFRYATVIYEMHDAVLAILDKYGIKRDVKKDGPLLQLLGTEWGRRTIHPDVWVQCAQNWHKQQVEKEDLYGKTVYLFDDLRFKNEFTAFPVDSLRIRLEAPRDVRKARADAWRDNETHQSETDLDDWLDKFELVVDTHINPIETVAKLILETINEQFSAGPGTDSREGLHAGRSEEGVEKEVHGTPS